jgi:ATP-dependent Clp protease adaptor protein ClpS
MKDEDDKNSANNLDASTEISEPGMYQVVMHNDDYTPLEFVIGILQKFFYMDRRQASDTTLEAHIRGQAVCGTFSRDCAETKMIQIREYVGQHEHPLQCSMEVA